MIDSSDDAKQIEKLYEFSERLNESKDKPQNVDYEGIIDLTKESVEAKKNLKAKQLAAQLIPRFFKFFPSLSDRALNTHIDLIEEDDLGVRVQAIRGLPLFCKDMKEHISKIVDILVQLLLSEEFVERDAVHKALMSILRQDVKESLSALFKHIQTVEEPSTDDGHEVIREKVLCFIRDKVFPLKGELLRPPDEMERHITDLIKKSLLDVTGAEFRMFMDFLKTLSIFGDKAPPERMTELVGIIEAQADLDAQFINSDCSHIGYAFTRLLKLIGTPVDFELPDWFNKWKPTPYTCIRRNIYLTKKIKRRLEDDGIFCSCMPLSGSSAVCGRDCHCGMLLSSCSSGCKCGSSCLNKPFQHRPIKKMKLVQTEKCGAGIVADEDIKQGEFVIEYVGEVIDDKTCEERLWNMKHRGVTNFYLCEINRDMVIDATYKGNKSRYINHSCCPNTEMQKWIIDGETRIGIFATRDIKRGEHLTYDYQFVQFGADQDCHCGAEGCRRKLGVKPTNQKMASDAALKLVACQLAVSSQNFKSSFPGKDVHHGGGLNVGYPLIGHNKPHISSCCCMGELIIITRPMNKRSFGIIKRFDKYTKKHSIMFEDGVIEFLDMSKEDWELVTL